jgi:hypothetical protein
VIKVASFNINGIKARLPAGDQDAGRGLSSRGLRGDRLQGDLARPKGLQRRRHFG